MLKGSAPAPQAAQLRTRLSLTFKDVAVVPVLG